MEQKWLVSLISTLISQTLVFSILFLQSPPLISPQFTTTTTTNRKRKHQQHEEETLTPFESMSIPQTPDQFKLLFHMSSSSFHFLSGLLDPLLPSSTTLPIALSRLASGQPYNDIARRFQIPVETALSSTKLLCRTLCINFRFHLSFPLTPSPFPGLPGCRGALATARFLTGPRSRSVSAQIVADAGSRIISIAAGFRGERGDGEVLKRSSLYRECEEGRVLGSNEYFVGGGGYPLLSWLMVPFDNVGRGTVEEDFNEVHRVMCRPAKRAVASLRSWRGLGQLEEEEDGRMVVACIATCSILHNMLLMREDYTAVVDEGDEGLGEDEGLEEEEEEDECFVEEKACVLRSTLAVKAREVRNS